MSNTALTRSETARMLASRLRDPHELSVFGSRALMADAAQLLDEFAALLDAPPAAIGSYQFTLGTVALTGHAADIGYGIYEQLLDPVLCAATRGLRELHAQRPDALLPAQFGLLSGLLSGLLGAIGGRLAAEFGAATADAMLQAASRAARQVEQEDAAGKAVH